MYSKYYAQAGEGKYLIRATATFLGSDISVSVGGGTLEHIGAVSLGVYEPIRNSATLSTISVHTHRDDAVASYFAKTISRELKCTVSVAAGIHVDDATEDEIMLLRNNSMICCENLISALRNGEEK